jgi:hypothetical protein
MSYPFKTGMIDQVAYVAFCAGKEIVYTDHMLIFGQQTAIKVYPRKPAPPEIRICF